VMSVLRRQLKRAPSEAPLAGLTSTAGSSRGRWNALCNMMHLSLLSWFRYQHGWLLSSLVRQQACVTRQKESEIHDRKSDYEGLVEQCPPGTQSVRDQ